MDNINLTLAHWTVNFDPVIFQISEKFAIRWYGLAYALGFVVAAWLLSIYYKKNKSPFNPDQQSTILFAIIIGVVVGGRLGSMLLYSFDQFIANPLVFFRFWEGGMASHGGFIGVTIAVFWVSKTTKANLLRTGDILVSLAPPGLFFGRIANFINGELWGKPSDLPWAMYFPASEINGSLVPRHPSQLYEAALEGLLLTIYTQLRIWKQNERPYGQLAGEFLLLYAIARIFCEIFRDPDAGLILGLSRGIFYSIFLAIAGIALILIAQKKKTAH